MAKNTSKKRVSKASETTDDTEIVYAFENADTLAAILAEDEDLEFSTIEEAKQFLHTLANDLGHGRLQLSNAQFSDDDEQLSDEQYPATPEKIVLEVFPDWYSTGIWLVKDSERQAAEGCIDYEDLPISPALALAFEIWQDWYNDYEPSAPEQFPFKRHQAMGQKLALTLQEELPSQYVVRYSGKYVVGTVPT